MSVKDFSQFVQFNPALFDHLAELGQTLGAQLEKITRLQFDAGLASTQEALAASRALRSHMEDEDCSGARADGRDQGLTQRCDEHVHCRDSRRLRDD